MRGVGEDEPMRLVGSAGAVDRRLPGRGLASGPQDPARRVLSRRAFRRKVYDTLEALQLDVRFIDIVSPELARLWT